jgi:hypothetical protein
MSGIPAYQYLTYPSRICVVSVFQYVRTDENRENGIPVSCTFTEAPLLRILDHQIVMLPILSLETCLVLCS